MAPGKKGFKLPLAVAWLTILGVVNRVEGSGHIEVHFVRYTDNCREDLGTNKCDPMFSFCLSTPQTGRLSVDNCNYASTGETRDHYHNTNDIVMEHLTNILGHPNPWVVLVNSFIEPAVMLVIKVRDADYIEHDHMQTWATTLRETVWATKEQSVWAERVMTSDTYSMRFKVRMYCDPFYYTSTCDVYCRPEDSSAGHYTCDSVTGSKICLPGWQGAQCTEDINECTLDYCVNGECFNLPGDYSCNCSLNYMGKNCTTLMNPCRSQPCQNGGECFAHHVEHAYFCRCPPNWEGDHCEKPKDPCLSNPCQNNGSCANSSDLTSYNCTCASPYSGANCETMLLPTSLETTLLPTTTTTTITTTPTTTVTDTPEPTSTTATMTEGMISTVPEFRGENVQLLTQKDGGNSFQMWYLVFIVAALVIVIVVVAVFLFKRRKHKLSQHDIMQTGMDVSFDGSQLAFENTMYNNANRNNSDIETQTRQLPPLPTNLANEDTHTSIKPLYTEEDETEGAAGGFKVVDSDLMTKSSANLVTASGPALGSIARPLSERAQTNPYADFNSLKDSQTAVKQDNDNHTDEGHYHDLDDITASVLQDGRDDSSDGAFNFNISETPGVTVLGSPYDFPSNNSSIYATPRATKPAVAPNGQTIKAGVDLTKNSDATNMLAPRRDVSRTDDGLLDNDTSDDETAQEDLAQLRKAVEDNMKQLEM